MVRFGQCPSGEVVEAVLRPNSKDCDATNCSSRDFPLCMIMMIRSPVSVSVSRRTSAAGGGVLKAKG